MKDVTAWVGLGTLEMWDYFMLSVRESYFLPDLL